MTFVLGKVAPGYRTKMNLLLDLVILSAASAWAASTRGAWAPVRTAFLWETLALGLAWMVIAVALRHYDLWRDRRALDEVAMVAVLVAAIAALASLLGLLGPELAPIPPGRLLLFAFPPLVMVRLALSRLRPRGDPAPEEVLIIGTGPLGRASAEQLGAARAPRRVVGYLSFSREAVPSSLTASWLGPSETLAQVLASYPADEVIIAGDLARDEVEIQRAVKTCEVFGVPFALPVHTLRLDRAQPLDPRGLGDGYVHYLGLHAKPVQMALKRMLDIVVSATALGLLLPGLLVVAALIKLTSRGPVFFGQVRVGLHGRPFRMLKFRSMVADAEQKRLSLAAHNELDGPVFKIRRDPRVTPLGRFLRKHSIDELPQLLNVLRGEMSLVGPRPPLPSEVAKYQAWQRRRLSVRPGLTCLWQVSGRNRISFEQWMYLDMRYIDHWSLREDLRLLVRTLPVVLSGTGAS
ncbi:MAG: sugar transferase [Deltaproteobacteria bacterium]|nr:sugar transferase [Deltaproteobacteria bacterium]